MDRCGRTQFRKVETPSSSSQFQVIKEEGLYRRSHHDAVLTVDAHNQHATRNTARMAQQDDQVDSCPSGTVPVVIQSSVSNLDAYTGAEYMITEN